MALTKRARDREPSVVATAQVVLTLATTQMVKKLAWEGPAGENCVRAREKE